MHDWFFPKKYFKSNGFTVEGFTFSFPKVKKAISDLSNVTKNFLEIENGIEKASNNFNSELFFPIKKYRR